jgi:prevent-host-death family protein
MKKIVNIYEAKTHLSRLLREVAGGAEIVIAKDGHPLARLVRIEPTVGARELGFAADRVRIADDFDAPLPDDVLDAFDATPA